MASLITKAAASSSFSFLPQSSIDHQNHDTYEVILSFRDKDTRFTVTGHLDITLCQRGIVIFRDDKINRGDDISQELLKAIEDSRVSIIVFSQNYASSRWCLDELVKILECRKSKGQKVRVVFYKVDASDVRHQTGTFGEAFATLDQCKYKDNMNKWRAALKAAADLSGWPLKDGRYETEFINEIVKELCAGVVNPSCELHVATHPIGLQSQDVINKLFLAKENIVRMVGIWGTGGIGKTTLAKDVFNSIRHKFEGSCFLADVRSKSLIQLQETLLVNILSDSTLKVDSVDKGVGLIKTRMRSRKVLLVLDDVNHSSQLQNLVPSPDCFGRGSRILITTRDTRLLTAHQVDEVYEVKMLGYDPALELFSLSAFKTSRPSSNYMELAQRAVRYAQGLPLALIVLGSHLYGRSREEWEATLDNCRGEDPQREITDVLKISYDALGVDLKGYFLDIACFFKGEHVDYVKPILEACYDLKSVNGIAQLREKALIRIDKNVIWMHDLIEEMGKDIVHQESPYEPGERSRVWSDNDANHVLTNNTGTNKVIGIRFPPRSSLNAKSFSKMKKLRYLSCRYSSIGWNKTFSGKIGHLSNQLGWLDWQECPFKCFPSDFHAEKLAKLDISYSPIITQLWEGSKNFSSLIRMDLRGCESLTELPEFRGIPNLKELDLRCCVSLVELPDSLGLLDKLDILQVEGCSNLTKFPRKINWKSFVSLTIRNCKLEEFPEVGEEMGSLTTLKLSGTCIKEWHQSITKLIGLENLSLTDCPNLTTLPHNMSELRNLKRLRVGICPKLAAFPVIPIKMDSLKELSLSCTGIRELGGSIGNLIGLKRLDLWGCHYIRTLPSSIYGLLNLERLSLLYCPNLVTFPFNILNDDGCALSLPKLKYLNIKGCGSSDCVYGLSDGQFC